MAKWLRHLSHATVPLPPARDDSNPARTDVIMREGLSVYLRKIGRLSISA
jgi:hypothetical protein